MKKLLLILLLPILSFGQLPYSWVNGVDPGWTSSNPSQNTLSWQPNYGAVSTSDIVGGNWESYNNNQVTTYTSPVYDMTCVNASLIHIELDMVINLENGWDYLYFDYSYNGGTTWNNAGAWTGQIFGINPTFDIPESNSVMFRFRFESDFTVNDYNCTGPWWNQSCSIYYADILDFSVECLTYLPVTLGEFNVVLDGTVVDINWNTYTETNCSHFIVEKSIDGKNWNHFRTVSGHGNTQHEKLYKLEDNRRDGITYYRLIQFDYNGVSDTLGVESYKSSLAPVIVKTVNTIGQEVDDSYRGVVIDIFSDNTTRKRIQ